jgi:O-antigen ligase
VSAITINKTAYSDNRPLSVILVILVTLTCLQVALDLKFYRFESTAPNSLSGAISMATQIWAFLGSCFLLITRPARKVGQSISAGRILFLLSLYLLAVTLVNGGQVLTYIPTIFLCWAISRQEVTPEFLLRTIFISCSLVLVFSLLILVIDPDSAIMRVNSDRLTPFAGQVAGITPHPNTLGLFAGFGLGMALLTDSASRRLRLFLGLISIVLIVGSGSRLAYWIGALAILFLFLKSGRFSISKNFSRFTALSALSLASFWIIVGLEPLLGVLNGRDKIWEEYIRFWQLQPIFGGGLDAGRFILLNGANTVTLVNGGQSHNEIIGDLVRGGILGLGLVLIFGLILFKQLKDQGLFERPDIVFVCTALLSAALVEQLVIFTMGSRTIFTFLLFMLGVMSTKYLSATLSDRTRQSFLQRPPTRGVESGS